MNAPMTAADLDRVAGIVLDVLWRCSWQASVLAVVVLGVQFALHKHLSARWRHALWGIVLLRLLIPVTPPSPWSLFNVAPHARGPQFSLAAITGTIAHTPQHPLDFGELSRPAVSQDSPRSWK